MGRMFRRQFTLISGLRKILRDTARNRFIEEMKTA